ncbi:hypothetical protein QYE76_067509 [Lolium multiflorum]|uniref:Reverse transcriptase/retrotransposon-derived protein RNase H-like domain-containing protein n=1 Tax=Lolium multiflorum TaxID=4521 RepID=A0AAD8SDF5_LOLMU|nr:hypothetical protein QYE76_067509 [Lolium multiflorum]
MTEGQKGKRRRATVGPDHGRRGPRPGRATVLGGPQPLSPPFLRVLLRPENLSHRGILTKGYSRLCGAENTREKRALRRAGIRRGNSLPEGEIDAIAIVIERDIISIIIIIISTIYTAITTAAPLESSIETAANTLLLVGIDILTYRRYYDTPPILVGHQDYFLAPLPGSEALLNEEFKRDLLDRIQENTEGWENDKDRESVIETVDNVIPEAYIEKTPFPAKMKEYSVISSAVNKSEKKPKEPEEQIKIEPAVAIVKDLVTENVEDGHIIFCEDASNIVSHPNKPKQVSVPMLSVRIGDHCYYGLCDIGASVSAIPYELYTEIMHEIGSCELEDIDVVIHLANRETISPIGIVRDVEVLCGKIKYPADFLVLGSAASDHCPIIFGRPFLNTCGAIIDCKKEKILTRFAGEPYEFNFSKFTKTPYKVDLPSNDFKMEQCASIVLVPNNPLQQHLENSESEAFRKERDELEEIFRRQPILKHDLPVEDLGTTPPPKEDPVFDLKPLPDNLKYAHIDDKKIYPVIISSKLSEIEEESIVEVFMDDFSVYGNSFDNCLRNLDKVLQRCEETNLVLNWEKCHFMVNEGIVLGHKISERGIEVDRAKVEAIEKMPYPRDVKGIRSVLGHAGFYRRFIKDFSKISKPLTNLLQKDVPFVFDDDCKEAFETLKKALTTAPVVEPPDWNLPFEIMCDASDFAVGAVLGQRVDKKLNVIHYANRKGADNPVADNLSRLENIAYDPVPVNDSFPNEQLAVIKFRSAMVSKNKGKEFPEEDNQDLGRKEEDKDVKEEDEEEVDEDSRTHPRATIASIKVVDNPFSANKSARIRTGGAVPRHYLAPKREGAEAEEWGNNSKSWDSPSDRLLNRVEHNSEMIRNLIYRIDELQEIIEKLVRNSSPPSSKE